MWDDGKQQELENLRELEDLGILSGAEQKHLTALLAELDAEETNLLQDSQKQREKVNRKLRAEVSLLRTQNASLKELEKRQATVVARARRQLDELLSEQGALQAEYQRVLKTPLGGASEGAR